MSDTIIIRTDHGPLTLPAGCTLDAAMARITELSGKDADRLATAVNGEFVARSVRPTHTLSDGDTVLCFSPITGG
jgi:sulfur carrier protein